MKNAEKNLWGAVLGQILKDAKLKSYEGRTARAVLSPGNRDFQMICCFAGMDPSSVIDRFHAGKTRPFHHTQVRA